jgi:methyl acetate hydrolase
LNADSRDTHQGSGGSAAEEQRRLWRQAEELRRESSNLIDRVLRKAVDEKKLPSIVAMVAVGDHVIYEGASGARDTIKNIPMTVDSIFHIASMTKPITSVAVMQLVESGRAKLDEPATTYLPELSQVRVLEEFDLSSGKARLRAS